MPDAPKMGTVEALLERYDKSYPQQLGIDIEKNTPSELFRWLCASILFSARISQDLALEAARALTDNGWTTARKMKDSTWRQRTDALNQAGYARYDESTSRMLGETAELLLEKYSGDLRKLRAAADRDPERERALLKECKGLGDTGVDIFFRGVQSAWQELYPFADSKALDCAKELGLPDDADQLKKTVPKSDFPRLTDALVICSLAKEQDAVREATV